MDVRLEQSASVAFIDSVVSTMTTIFDGLGLTAADRCSRGRRNSQRRPAKQTDEVHGHHRLLLHHDRVCLLTQTRFQLPTVTQACPFATSVCRHSSLGITGSHAHILHRPGVSDQPLSELYDLAFAMGSSEAEAPAMAAAGITCAAAIAAASVEDCSVR